MRPQRPIRRQRNCLTPKSRNLCRKQRVRCPSFASWTLGSASMARRLLWAALALGFLSHVAVPTNVTAVPGIAGPKAIVTPPAMSDGLLKDRAALLALRNSIYSIGFGRSRIKAAWSRSVKANPCFPQPWPHCECLNGRVVAIHLANMDILAANLPTQLSTMDALITLDLSGNSITGVLPDVWGRRLAFQSLKTLLLQDNNLHGSLPNWSAKGAWQSLQTLNLADNSLTGGLPVTWAGNLSPLRRLVTLDLSFNYLGLDGSTLPDAWGSTKKSNNPFAALRSLKLSQNSFSGSLPNWGKQYAFPSLRFLDLSYNKLTGTPPDGWGSSSAFPRLQQLVLSGNDLGSPTSPGGLPAGWTRPTVPRAFPSLVQMVLYPGNNKLCAWLNGKTQYSATYAVTDDSQVAYDATNPWLCPDPGSDNVPSMARLSQLSSGQVLHMEWTGPAVDAGYACGFRTLITNGNGALVYSVDWQVRPDITSGLTVNANSPPTYSADSNFAPSGTGMPFSLEVSTLNCNRYVYSSTASDTYTSI